MTIESTNLSLSEPEPEMAKVAELVSKLSMLQAYELRCCLEELGLKFNLEIIETNTPIFAVELTGYANDRKISVIKSVRNITDMSLRDTKIFVESPPGIVMKGMMRRDAEQVVKDIEIAGGAARVVRRNQ